MYYFILSYIIVYIIATSITYDIISVYCIYIYTYTLENLDDIDDIDR